MPSGEIIRQFEQDFNPLKSTLAEGTVMLFYGPPCAGKSTIGRQLAFDFNCHFLSIDDLRSHYKNEELFSEINNAEVLDIFFRKVRFLAKKRQSIICEGMFYSDDRKTRFKDYLKPFKVDFIYLTASIELLLNRLNARNNDSENKDFSLNNELTPDLLTFYFNQFLKSKHEVEPIDTGHLTPTEIVELIKGGIVHEILD